MSESETFKYGTLFCGDARELIKNAEDGSVDLILTDPPYGLEADEFDKPDVFYEIEDELYRVAKPDAWLVFFNAIGKFPQIFSLKKFNYVWVMTDIIFASTTLSYGPLGLVRYRPIFVFKKGSPRIFKSHPDVFWAEELPDVERVRDAQAKSTFICAKLLEMFSEEGQTVLDPFAGYGSIPLVCELYGRRWMGFEIDYRKYQKAVRFIRYFGKVKWEREKEISSSQLSLRGWRQNENSL